MKVDADDLIAFAKTLEGQVLETLTRKRQFTVLVTPVRLEYTPLSTGKTREQYNNIVKRICDQFSETNSFSGRDYGFTKNSSYILAIISKYVER